jgi:histidinol dehydrogenase/sulfopropanediol 3-dehydrogenase
MPALPPKVEYIKSPIERQKGQLSQVEALVRGIIEAVRDEGDQAVRKYSKTFDDYQEAALEVTAAERAAAVAALEAQTRKDSQSPRSAPSRSRSSPRSYRWK